LNYKTILVAESASIRTITLNRPERRNAMTPEMQIELIAAMEDAAASDCRVVVLAGAGEAFCSGLDLSALQAMQDKGAAEYRKDAERFVRLSLALYELPMPTIAVLHGAAVAGGAGLAMVCDFALATPAAKFGFTEVRIGFVPAVVSAFLTLKVGDRWSRDLLLTGRLVDAAEALQLGLVNEIVQAEELAQRVQTLAEALIANSPQSLNATKRLMATQNKVWLDTAITEALDANARSRETADFREGVAAFLEKRKPVWGKVSRGR
jgi:methylglutaconyl-CoA hydratase